MTLAVYEDGARDAPALVLLHSIATSAALWQPQLGALTARFRLIRVDLPGHGASAPLPDGASFADYADAVAAALAERGVDRFVLAGLSFGAMVALRLAAAHPGGVERLALACCAVHTPPPVAAMWRERISAVEKGGMDAQVGPTLARWFTPAFASASPLTRDWIAGLIHATPPAGFAAAASIIAGLDQTTLLPRLTMPCLVLAGEHDQAAAPDMMRGFAATIPEARFAALPAAHLANVEAPTAFAETLGAFAAG